MTPAPDRESIARMRETLVHARMALADMTAAIEKTRASLEAERAELEKIRRRRTMAEQIGDNETVEIATRFETKHAQRADVLERKLVAQEEELRLTEAEVASMTSDLRSAARGIGATSPDTAAAKEADELLNEAQVLQSEIDGLARKRSREAREADAAERLAELKRRMGK